MYTQTVIKEAAVSVSVGICATTELANTVRLTEQILHLESLGMNLTEVIVVTPNHQLARNLAKLAEDDPRVFVVLETRREGKAAALNKIIKRSTGDILVLASADIQLSPYTLPRMIRSLTQNPEWGAVDSRVELINGDKLMMDRIDNFVWGIHNATLDDLDDHNRLGHAGDLLAVRRRLVGQFPDVINDDGYLALAVQEKGFRVKRLRDAPVRIIGPQTPADYVYQRSRILRGHLQLMLQFHKMPTTFEFSAFWKPRRNLKILLRTVGRFGPSYLAPLFVAGFLELVSFQIALVSQLTARPNRPWRIVQSTKQAQNIHDVPIPSRL